jgi:hypothetical protein
MQSLHSPFCTALAGGPTAVLGVLGVGFLVDVVVVVGIGKQQVATCITAVYKNII